MVEGLAAQVVEQQETNEVDIFPKPNFVFDVIEANRDLQEVLKDNPELKDALISGDEYSQITENAGQENLRLILQYIEDPETRKDFIRLLENSKVLELVESLEKRFHVSKKAQELVIAAFEQLNPNIQKGTTSFEEIAKNHPLFVQIVIQQNEEIYTARNYHGWSASGEISDSGVPAISNYFHELVGQKDVAFAIDTSSTLLYDTKLTKKGEAIFELINEESKKRNYSYETNGTTIHFVLSDDRSESFHLDKGIISDHFSALLDVESSYYHFNRGFFLVAGHSTGARVAEDLCIFLKRDDKNTELIELAPAHSIDNYRTLLQGLILSNNLELGNYLTESIGNPQIKSIIESVIELIGTRTTKLTAHGKNKAQNLFRETVDTTHGKQVKTHLPLVLEQIGIWTSNRLPSFDIPIPDKLTTNTINTNSISYYELNNRITMLLFEYRATKDVTVRQKLFELLEIRKDFLNGEALNDEFRTYIDIIFGNEGGFEEKHVVPTALWDRLSKQIQAKSKIDKPIEEIAKEVIFKFFKFLKEKKKTLHDLFSPEEDIIEKLTEIRKKLKIDPIQIAEIIIACIQNPKISRRNLQGHNVIPLVVLGKNDRIVDLDKTKKALALSEDEDQNFESIQNSKPEDKIEIEEHEGEGHYGPVETFREQINKMFDGLNTEAVEEMINYSTDKHINNILIIATENLSKMLEQTDKSDKNLLQSYASIMSVLLLSAKKENGESLTQEEKRQVINQQIKKILIEKFPNIAITTKKKLFEYIVNIFDSYFESEDRKAKLEKE